MDIAQTMNLLQSQSQNSAGKSVQDKFAPNSPANKDSNDTADTQQPPREEFSTFLTLLTAQIKNQDPLAPLDSTQFVEQLATFTNLELQAKGNQSLERIAALLASQIELLTPTENANAENAKNGQRASLDMNG